MPYPDEIDANFSKREIAHDIHPLLANRWSPRAFQKTEITDEDVMRLFEAARVAPSCYNEQPWRFYVSTDKTFEDFLSLLVPGNQEWAKNASLLGFIAGKKTFTRNDKANDYNEFDSGAAWMSLTIQARAMGLYTHGMGGIKKDEVTKHFSISEEFAVICGFAIGVIASPEVLPEEAAKDEQPTARKPLTEILIRD